MMPGLPSPDMSPSVFTEGGLGQKTLALHLTAVVHVLAFLSVPALLSGPPSRATTGAGAGGGLELGGR
jgi:hypothetical protein